MWQDREIQSTKEGCKKQLKYTENKEKIYWEVNNWLINNEV